jgi:hypothetical protein
MSTTSFLGLTTFIVFYSRKRQYNLNFAALNYIILCHAKLFGDED